MVKETKRAPFLDTIRERRASIANIAVDQNTVKAHSRSNEAKVEIRVLMCHSRLLEGTECRIILPLLPSLHPSRLRIATKPHISANGGYTVLTWQSDYHLVSANTEYNTLRTRTDSGPASMQEERRVSKVNLFVFPSRSIGLWFLPRYAIELVTPLSRDRELLEVVSL